MSGATRIASGLAQNAALTILNLACNKVGPAGAARLSEAVAANESLIVLDLQDNDGASCGQAESLKASLQRNRAPKLREEFLLEARASLPIR